MNAAQVVVCLRSGAGGRPWRCRTLPTVSNWIEWLDLEMCREVNDAMHELKRRFPERILTLAHVPIGEPGALDELERCVSLGVSGVFSIVHLPRLGWSLDH